MQKDGTIRKIAMTCPNQMRIHIHYTKYLCIWLIWRTRIVQNGILPHQRKNIKIKTNLSLILHPIKRFINRDVVPKRPSLPLATRTAYLESLRPRRWDSWCIGPLDNSLARHWHVGFEVSRIRWELPEVILLYLNFHGKLNIIVGID